MTNSKLAVVIALLSMLTLGYIAGALMAWGKRNRIYRHALMQRVRQVGERSAEDYRRGRRGTDENEHEVEVVLFAIPFAEVCQYIVIESDSGMGWTRRERCLKELLTHADLDHAFQIEA